MTEGGANASEPAGMGGIAILIRRPVLAAAISLLIVVAGLAALTGVEVRELPDTDTPVVTVTTTYPGAAAETIDTEITSLVEGAVARVEGVRSVSSSSSYGRSRITLEFGVGVDLNVAALDVREAAARIERELPEDADPPVVAKADADADPIMRLTVSSQTLSKDALTRLVDDLIVDRLAAVEGVAQVDTYGAQPRILEVRVRLIDLAARGLSIEDVESALSTVSINAAAGALESADQSIIVRTLARANTPEAIEALEITPETKIGDIGFVRWTLEDAASFTRANGGDAVGLSIIRQARSNTIQISSAVRAEAARLRDELPGDVVLAVTTDDAVFIQGSIREVATSLVLATAIVILVIFLFLRSARATLAPALAIPISILGAIAAIWLAGFSINIISLLALVVATGIVVDDAIVVLENIVRWRRKGVGPMAAAALGAREIVFAVLSTTAVLAAVFIPISFLPGKAGGVFAEFGFVLAFAVAVSSVVALTLCPMVAARVVGSIEPDPDGASQANAAPALGPGIGGALSRFYGRTLRMALGAPLVTLTLALGFAAGALALSQALPSELTPPEDRGVIIITARAQQGVSLDYLSRKIAPIEVALEELRDAGEVSNVLSLIGRGAGNRAFIIASLTPWEARARSQQEIQAALRPRVSRIPGLTVRLRSPNSLGIRGGGQGLSFAVTGQDYVAIAEAAEDLAARLAARQGFTTSRLNFETAQPQLSVEVDREASTALGASIDSIATLVSTMVDDRVSARVFVEDEIVDVVIAGGGRPVNDPGDLETLFVRTASGGYAPLSSFVTMTEEAVSVSLPREGRRRAATVLAGLEEGFSLGAATEALREEAADVLEPPLALTLLGEAATLEESEAGLFLVFGFAVLIVLIVLAAQFESVISALVIMATVPFGVAAALYALLATGQSINYYSQIGLVLLVGVMAKNGILIVEFANQRRDEGASAHDAALVAAETRLRAVSMTAVSTVLGALPLILSSGPGAEARMALGWVVIGGLGFSTLFTLYLTPLAYSLLARFSAPKAEADARMRGELQAARALRSAAASKS